MNCIARIFGSLTFRLAVVYTLIFAVSVTGLFYFVYYSTAGYTEQQKEAAIEADITSFAEAYDASGLLGLISAVNRRSDPNTASRDAIYVLQDSLGNVLAGNLRSWPRNAIADADDQTWVNFTINDLRGASPELADVRAMRLVVPGPEQSYILLVGRDVRDVREFRDRLLNSLFVGLAITLALGVLGGFMFSRTIMGRIEAITRTCRGIMSGELSQRVNIARPNDELGQLSLSINAMLDQIERLMKGMQQVSDNVAHDLRTPLNRLRSRLESALRRTKDPAEREAIEDALADAESLLATFAALLRIARAEAGAQRNFIDVDLHALAEEAVDLYGPLAEEKGLSFVTRLQPGLMTRGDPNLIAQALANLIDNAIKYTEEGSVTVALTLVDGRPAFVVGDTGPGIPDEYKDKVLERLFRLEQSRTSPGSGLGLSLVAAVAKSHGLALKLEDNTPGLRVTLRFPPTQVHAGDPKSIEAHAPKHLPVPKGDDKKPIPAAA